jgi:hypothetical protein
MKASDVIKRLQQLAKRDGDLDVEVYVPCVGKFEPLHDIQPRRDHGASSVIVDFFGVTTSEIGDEANQTRFDNTPFGTRTA